MDPQGMKRCCRCKELKPYKKFQKRTNTEDKLAPFCKRCAKKIYRLSKRNELAKPSALVLYEILRDYNMDRVTYKDEMVWWKFNHITGFSIEDVYRTIHHVSYTTSGKIIFELCDTPLDPSNPNSPTTKCLKIRDNVDEIERIYRKYNRK